MSTLALLSGLLGALLSAVLGFVITSKGHITSKGQAFTLYLYFNLASKIKKQWRRATALIVVAHPPSFPTAGPELSQIRACYW